MRLPVTYYEWIEGSGILRCIISSFRADCRFAPSQWETAFLCNDVSDWPGTSLDSSLSWLIRYAGIGASHYSDVMMRAMTSQITGVSIVSSIVCSDADKRKHQSSASRWPMNSPPKGQVTRRLFPFDDVIMASEWILNFIYQLQLNSLWPSDAKKRKGTESTLAQVMASCLTAPSHYLNQCWLLINKVLWH